MSLFLQTFLASDRAAAGRERPIGAGCIPSTRVTGSSGNPRQAMRGRTHLAVAGRHTGDSTPGSRGWLLTARRRFVSPLRKAFPALRQPLSFAHCTTTGLMSQRKAPGSCPLPHESPEPGRGRSPSCGGLWGERFYLGAGAGAYRFLICLSRGKEEM